MFLYKFCIQISKKQTMFFKIAGSPYDGSKKALPTAKLKMCIGNTAQFPPCGLSTAPAAAARHLRCQNAR
jgi:hypothetical protein